MFSDHVRASEGLAPQRMKRADRCSEWCGWRRKGAWKYRFYV